MTCVSETSPITANAVIEAIEYGQKKIKRNKISEDATTERLVQCFIASYVNFYMSVRNNPNNKADKVEHCERCMHIRVMISSATTLIAIAKILSTKTDQDLVATTFKSEQQRMCANTGNMCADMLADMVRKKIPLPLEFRADIQAHFLPAIIHKRLRQAKDITKRVRRQDPSSAILKSIPVGTTVNALQYLIDAPLSMPAETVLKVLRDLIEAPLAASQQSGVSSGFSMTPRLPLLTALKHRHRRFHGHLRSA